MSQITSADANPSLKWLNRNYSAKLRLICFPCAGGTAATFRRWARFLPAMVELCGIELPGRGMRHHEPLITDLSSMMEMLIGDLRHNLDIPTVFFGHSMGAIVCFEMTRWLRRAGLPQPLHLFVSACCAPQNRARGEPMLGLSDHKLMQRLLCLEGTPVEVFDDEKFVSDFMPVLRADLTLADQYQYRHDLPLDLPIWAFGGASDQEVLPEDLDDWRVLTRSDFAQHIFSGGHFYFRASEAEFLKVFSKRLESIAVCAPSPARQSNGRCGQSQPTHAEDGAWRLPT